MTEMKRRTYLYDYVIFVFPVSASICKPFAEPTFEQATYVKNIHILNQCTLLLKIDLELY
jgi:hypothetical protein